MATLALCHFDPRLDKYKTIHLGPAPSEEGSPSWFWNQTMLGDGIQNRKLPFTSLPPPEVVVYIVDFWIFQYGRFKGDEIRDPVIWIGIISFQPWSRDPIVNQSNIVECHKGFEFWTLLSLFLLKYPIANLFCLICFLNPQESKTHHVTTNLRGIELWMMFSFCRVEHLLVRLDF